MPLWVPRNYKNGTTIILGACIAYQVEFLNNEFIFYKKESLIFIIQNFIDR